MSVSIGNRNNKDVIVQFFHAKWCGHCTNFLPKWKEIVQEISKKYSNVTAESYEQTDPKNEKIFKENNIQGYPTILINGKKFGGPREKDSIFKAIKDAGGIKIQSGGRKNNIYDENYYKKKYLKYKAKYMKKLDELN